MLRATWEGKKQPLSFLIFLAQLSPSIRRIAALMIWGKPAAGGKYAAIAALTNIPATLFASLVYELIFVDSSRGSYLLPIFHFVLNSQLQRAVLPRAQQDFLNGHKAHLTHTSLGAGERRQGSIMGAHSSTDKGDYTKDV